MKITTRNSQAQVPVTVLHIEGDLNAETSEQLVQEAQAAYEAGNGNLLLDLGKVDLMSSAGLRAIHSIFMMLGPGSAGESESSVRQGIVAGTYHSPHLKLLNPSKAVRHTLELGGFDTFLEIFSNEQEALASY
jgi:anti-anti-sigma regulatory factor